MLLSKEKGDALGNFTAYNHRFRMPWRESGASSNMWYSFNYGPVHFVQIDTETDFPGSPNDQYRSKNGGFGDQLAWLEQDLRQANKERSLRPWVLVAGHRPVYSLKAVDSTGTPTGAELALQQAVEEMFYKYEVDMYLCGHQHSYERHWPVYQSKRTQTNYINPRATVYVVNGASGNVEGHSGGYGVENPDWENKWNNGDYGVGFIKVHNNTHLDYTFVESATGVVNDTFTLVKYH